MEALEKIVAVIKCLIPADETAWQETQCIVVELGLKTKNEGILWKNAGEVQISHDTFSTANVPGIWEPASAGMVLRYTWIYDKGPPSIFLKKQIVKTNGKTLKGRVIKIGTHYTDDHLGISVDVA